MPHHIVNRAKADSVHRKDLDIHIKSVDTSAAVEQPLSHAMEMRLGETGIDSAHRSPRLQWDRLDRADLMLTMTRAQKYWLISQIPEMVPKLFTLKDYIGDIEHPDLDVPSGTDLDSYRCCADEIATACDRLPTKFQPPP